jgi:hypothetical protein
LPALVDVAKELREDRHVFDDALAAFRALRREPREHVTPVLEARPEERQGLGEGEAHRRDGGGRLRAMVAGHDDTFDEASDAPTSLPAGGGYWSHLRPRHEMPGFVFGESLRASRGAPSSTRPATTYRVTFTRVPTSTQPR